MLGSVGLSAALTALFACAGPSDSSEAWSESNPDGLSGAEVAEEVPPATLVDARFCSSNLLPTAFPATNGWSTMSTRPFKDIRSLPHGCLRKW